MNEFGSHLFAINDVRCHFGSLLSQDASIPLMEKSPGPFTRLCFSMVRTLNQSPHVSGN